MPFSEIIDKYIYNENKPHVSNLISYQYLPLSFDLQTVGHLDQTVFHPRSPTEEYPPQKGD